MKNERFCGLQVAIQRRGIEKVGFVMDGQDAKELSDFYAYESIHIFNDTTHYKSIHFHVK